MKKRIIGMLLLVSLILGSLVGCGKNDKTTENVLETENFTTQTEEIAVETEAVEEETQVEVETEVVEEEVKEENTNETTTNTNSNTQSSQSTQEDYYADLSERQKKVVDAGYWNIIQLDETTYAVLTDGREYMDKNTSTMRWFMEELEKLGVDSFNIMGRWIHDGPKWYWFLAEDCFPYDPSFDVTETPAEGEDVITAEEQIVIDAGYYTVVQIDDVTYGLLSEGPGMTDGSGASDYLWGILDDMGIRPTSMSGWWIDREQNWYCNMAYNCYPKELEHTRY